ncbi:Uncharacterised protein [Mycobacteroides abscessus subsp. abscessus]|nr:Uncharacterised protein [Mycobacteroides abscessus subsp. abscessus]
MAGETVDHLGGAGTGLPVTGEHGPADDIGMAVDELRRRMDDEVGAELDRTLQVRGRERRIDGEESIVGVGDARGLDDVDDVEAGVARGLGPDDRGAVGDRRFQRLGVGEVDGADDDAPALVLILEQPIRSAVDVAGDDDLVAGTEQSGEHGDLGRRSRVHGRRVRRPFEVAQHLFEVAAVRGARARVVEAGPGHARDVHLEGRGLEDRGDDGTGVRFRGGAGVHRAGRDSAAVCRAAVE